MNAPVLNLSQIALTDNKITGGLELLANAGLDNLNHLDLSGNRISSIDAVKKLVSIIIR